MANNSILAKMAVQITANTAQFNAALAQTNKQLGIFQKGASFAGKALVGVFAGQQLFNGIKSAVGIMADFEVQMSTVRAITGATGDTFKALEKNALDLGRSTRYTATQVGSLQVEYGRLGFTSKEIINATKSTLNLATATGSDLARSAEIAGSTLRAFQIDAKETGRVTDIIASALNKSALSLDSFGEGIKYVAPVAKAVNVTLEETSALMSVLADAGIKGSQAGTSLRRIFTLLTKDGKPLSDRLQELANKGITLADANDEVGLYAQTALLVLANQNEKVKELTGTFQLANGETQRMADIMEDNLTGSVTKLSSAWDGLILSFSNSKGVLRDGADALTDIVSVFGSDKISGLQKFLSFQALITGNVKVFNDLADSLKEVAKAEDEAAKKQSEYITDSATVLLRDYGYNIAAITNALAENKDAFEILAEVEKLHTAEVKANAEATTENTRKQLADNEALKARIALEKDRAAAKARGEATREQGVSFSVGGFDTSKLKFAPDSAGIAMQEGQASIQNMIAEAMKRANDNIEKQKMLVMQNREAWANLGSTISDSISQSIAGGQTLLQSLSKITATIINQLEQITLARMVANSAKFGIPGILAAAAGFGVVKGIFNKLSKENSQSTYASPSYAKVTMYQRGSDLVGSISETTRIGRRTRG